MKQSYFKYILALLLFGSNGVVASYIVLNSYEIVFARTLIGSLFLLIVFILAKGKVTWWKNKRHFGYLAISGSAMGASWMFLYEAYTQIGISISTLIYYCGPVIVVALSTLIFQERLTCPKILGFFAVSLGMVCVNGSNLLQGGFSWGLLCGVMSALTYTLMVIFNKKATSITGLENSMFQLFVSFFTVTAFMLMRQGISVSVAPQNIFPILLLGVVNTGMGCYLYFSSIQQLPAGSVAICGYLEPLSALIFSVLLLKERLTLIQVVGAALILGGAALGELFHKSVTATNRD